MKFNLNKLSCNYSHNNNISYDAYWTNTGLTDSNRYFCMGNALVVNVVKELADEIGYIVDSEN